MHMKIKRKQTLIFTLAAAAIALLPSCGTNETIDSSESTNGGGSTPTLNTKHQFIATPTSSYLLQNGKTPYKVIIPKSSDDQLLYARSELVNLFKEATDIELSVITESASLTFNEESTYISLGTNSYWNSASLGDKANLDDFGRDGSRIVTKGKSVFIFGNTNYGTLYGVYNFLKLNFNFETYYHDCYSLDKNVKDLHLCNYDVIDIPDISKRVKRGLLFPTANQNQMFTYRMRTADDVATVLLPIHLGDSRNNVWNANHNSFYYFPKDKYEKAHPKFYAPKGDQLCFTARGDEAELTKMVEFAAEKIEQSLTWYPTAEYPTYSRAFLGMNDVPDLCDCEACTKVKDNHNGAIVSTVILFMKRVGKLVNAWMDKPENAAYKRDMDYSFFAYQSAITPPFKENDDGTFEYNPDIIPEDGVKLMPFVASMNFDYGRSFYSSANDEARKILKAWGNFYPGTWAWSYGGFFNDYISFYDIYNFYTDYHEYLAKYNYSLSFEQVKNDQRGADPGFGGLANYVLCKKSWDSSLDINDLIEDFMNNMYEDAAPVMKEMLHKLRVWFAKIIEKFGIGNGGSMQSDISGNKKYYGIGFLQELFELCDEAYGKIEVYKKDQAKYKRLKTYIDIEWLFPAKVAISCYETSFTHEEYVAIKKKFKNLCLDLSIKDIKEFTSINSFLESLGV